MPKKLEREELDPTFVHARREAWLILFIFAIFAAYTLSVSHWLSPPTTIGVAERKLLGESNLTIPNESKATAQVATDSNSPNRSFALPSGAVSPKSIATIGGIPNWAFFGIVLPWIAAIAVTGWFCFVRMSDDPLGEAGFGSSSSSPSTSTVEEPQNG